MDITRLPVTPLGHPASASAKNTRQPVTVDAVARPAGAGAHGRSREPLERVVQGELLHRQRASYQSTRSFIDERSLDRALPAGQEASPQQSRLALTRYLGNLGTGPVSEPSRGRSVNFFV